MEYSTANSMVFATGRSTVSASLGEGEHSCRSSSHSAVAWRDGLLTPSPRSSVSQLDAVECAPLRDPDQLVSALLERGLELNVAAQMVTSYYDAAAVQRVVAPSDHVSSQVSRSTRSSVRLQGWRAKMVALSDEPGCSYLRPLRWGRRSYYKEQLGTGPTMREFVAMLRPGDLDVDSASLLRVYRLPSRGGLIEVNYHVAREHAEGELIGSVVDVVFTMLQVYPFVNRDFKCTVGNMIPGFPLVGSFVSVQPTSVVSDPGDSLSIGPVVSQVSSASLSSQQRRDYNMVCTSSVAQWPDNHGRCYLHAVRMHVRLRYAVDLGVDPFFQTFVARLLPGDLDLDGLKSLHVWDTTSDGPGPRRYHVTTEQVPGRLGYVGTFYSVLSVYLRLYPWTNTKLSLPDDGVLESFPVVGVIGSHGSDKRSASVYNAGYCYLRLFAQASQADVAATLGPYPLVRALLDLVDYTHARLMPECVFEQVGTALFHVVARAEVRSSLDVYCDLCEVARLGELVRVGVESVCGSEADAPCSEDECEALEQSDCVLTPLAALQPGRLAQSRSVARTIESDVPRISEDGYCYLELFPYSQRAQAARVLRKEPPLMAILDVVMTTSLHFAGSYRLERVKDNLYHVVRDDGVGRTRRLYSGTVEHVLYTNYWDVSAKVGASRYYSNQVLLCCLLCLFAMLLLVTDFIVMLFTVFRWIRA